MPRKAKESSKGGGVAASVSPNMTAPVKDRGYAWLVLVASCTLQFFSIGFSVGGLGVMVVSFSKRFPEADVGQISWIGSLRGFQFLSSPFAVLLIKRFGCRPVTIAGALIAAAGLALAAISTAVWHAYLTFGIMTGIGVAFNFTCSTAVLGDYFDKKKNIAFPVSCLGYSVGFLVFPYVLQLILDHAGHENALYIMAAIKAIEVGCGIIFKPNKPCPVPKTEDVNLTVAGNRDISHEAAIACNVVDETSKVSVGETGNPRYEINANLRNTKTDIDDAKQTKTTVCMSHSLNGPDEAIERVHESAERSKSSLSNDSGSECHEEKRLHSSVGDHQSPGKASTSQKEMNSFLRMVFLLRDWKCWLLVLHAFAWGFCVVAGLVLAPISVKQRGVSEENASLGVAIFGAGMLLSSFIILGLGARKYDRFAVYLPMSALLGIAYILLSVSNLAVAYFILFGISGSLFGFLVSLFLSVLSDFKSAEDYADLFGLYLLLHGIGGIAGPAAMGGIQASVGDSAGWYTVGSVGIVGSILLIPIYVLKRRQQVREKCHVPGSALDGTRSAELSFPREENIMEMPQVVHDIS